MHNRGMVFVLVDDRIDIIRQAKAFNEESITVIHVLFNCVYIIFSLASKLENSLLYIKIHYASKL